MGRIAGTISVGAGPLESGIFRQTVATANVTTHQTRTLRRLFTLGFIREQAGRPYMRGAPATRSFASLSTGRQPSGIKGLKSLRRSHGRTAAIAVFVPDSGRSAISPYPALPFRAPFLPFGLRWRFPVSGRSTLVAATSRTGWKPMVRFWARKHRSCSVADCGHG